MSDDVSITVQPITRHRDLRAMDAHGRGAGEKAEQRRREDATHRALAFAWHDGRLRGGLDGRDPGMGVADGFDVVGAFARFKAQHDIHEYKGAAITQHAIVGVPAWWVAETGDPNDPKNPRVKELVDAAIGFGNREYAGDGEVGRSVYAARYDLDERGSAKVDLFLAPSYRYRVGRGQPKLRISLRKADRALARLLLPGPDGKDTPESDREALHTRWAAFANDRLGTAFGRGEYAARANTRKKQLSPEAYGAKKDAERKAELERLASSVTAKASANAAREVVLTGRELTVERREANVDAAIDGLEDGYQFVAEGARATGQPALAAKAQVMCDALEKMRPKRKRKSKGKKNPRRRKAIDDAIVDIGDYRGPDR